MKEATATQTIHHIGPKKSFSASIDGSSFGSPTAQFVIAKTIQALPRRAAPNDTHPNVFDMVIRRF